MGLFDKKANRGHNTTKGKQGFQETGTKIPEAPTPRLTRKEIKAQEAEEKARAKAREEKAAREEAIKGADLDRYGTFSKYWPWMEVYEKKRNSPERKIFLEKLISHTADYYDEDYNHPKVLELKRKIAVADRYDYIDAALSHNYNKAHDIFIAYINQSVRRHQYRGHFDLDYTPLAKLCEDIALTAGAEDMVNLAWQNAKDQENDANGLPFFKYLQTRKIFENAPISEPWVRTSEETRELLNIEMKNNNMDKLRVIFDSKDAYSAKAKMRRVFDLTTMPYLKTPVRMNYFTEAVDNIIDKVYAK